MNDINELIAMADRFCANLDSYVIAEKRLSDDIAIALENYSHDVYRMSADLKEIKYYVGV